MGTTEILEVVGQLHEGVVDDRGWERAIAHVCCMLDLPVLTISTIGHDLEHSGFRFVHGIPPQLLALLTGSLADPAHNPWLTLASTHSLRRLATVDDIGGLDHLKSTRMWSEYYVPFGAGDILGAPLERQPEYADLLMVGRTNDKPDFNSKEKRAFQVLVPHIARAWRVKCAMAEMEAVVGSLKLVLDRIDRAVVVVGPGGEVRFANRSADHLLTRGDSIDVRNGRLRAKRSGHTKALLALIGRAAGTAVGAEFAAVDAVALPSDDETAPLAVVAEPLAPAHSDRIGHAAAAGAILFIGDSEASRSPSEERMRVVYGLTAAEAKLASVIVAGEGIASASLTLSISPNTTKYHLKSVFGKVGVLSQAQLVRRVLADVGGLAEPERLRPLV